MKKIFNQKNFDLIIFAFKFTLRYLQPDIVPIVCYRCQRQRWQSCCWCCWYLWSTCGNLPPVSTTLTSEIGGKICCRCCWYWWCTLNCEYLRKFSKKFETVLMGYSGAGGKLIHKKTRSKNSRGTVPLRSPGTDSASLRSYRNDPPGYIGSQNRFLGSVSLQIWALMSEWTRERWSLPICARICRPFMEPRNRFPAWRAGTQPYLSYLPARARICRPFMEPKNRFSGWRAGTTTLFVVPARQAT
jgi:hypothetical protein